MSHPSPQDKTKSILWARDLFEQHNFYVLDTETTGVGVNDEIVQLGIVDKNGQTVMNTLIKPTLPIPAGASNVHGIYDKDVQNAPTLDDVYVSLSSTLAGGVVIAYNMDFDWRMLEQTIKVYQLPLFRVSKKHCAMKEYARFRGVKNPRYGDYKWHKLSDACRQEGLPVENAHDALGDVQMTLTLIRKMAEG